MAGYRSAEVAQRGVDQQRAVLERVLAESLDFLGGLPTRPVNARADVDEVAAALGGPLRRDGADPLTRHRGAGGRGRTGRGGHAVAPLLRLGDRRGAPGRPRRRLADLGVGPERRSAGVLARGRRSRAGGRRLAARPARAAGESAVGLRHRRHDGQLHLPGRGPGRRAAAGRLGRRGGRVAGLSARTGPGRSRTARHHRPVVAAARTRRGAGDRDRRWTSRVGSCPRRSPPRSTTARPTSPPSSACRRATSTVVRTTRSTRPSPSPTGTGPGCTSTGPSGCGRRPRPPSVRLLAGSERADSWATDAHKTLNVPYDNGIAIVADAASLHTAMGVHAAYLIQDSRPDPMAAVPEFSRRARGFTVWAALRSLGRDGVAEMVDGLVARARRVRRRLGSVDGVEIVNDVVFTQVCVSFGSDAGHPGGGPAAARRRNGLDDAVHLARTDGAAHLGLQPPDHRRGRGRLRGGAHPDPGRRPRGAGLTVGTQSTRRANISRTAG